MQMANWDDDEKYNVENIIKISRDSINFGPIFNLPITFWHDNNGDHILHIYETNQNVIIPDVLMSIEFGDAFNQPVILPEGLEYIRFGDAFDQPITLPEGLKSVTFRHNFNHNVIIPTGTSYVFLYNNTNTFTMYVDYHNQPQYHGDFRFVTIMYNDETKQF